MENELLGSDFEEIQKAILGKNNDQSNAVVQYLSSWMKKRFEAGSIVQSMLEKIRQHARDVVYKKYGNKILSEQNLNFSLQRVTSTCYTSSDSLTLPKVSVSLYYLCNSKVNKYLSDIIKSEKKYLQNNNRWNNCNRKINVVYHLSYELSIQEVMSEKFTLNLKLE